MKDKEILRIEGPFGSFFLREESTKPIVLLAAGTGFAPIKALIEHMQLKAIDAAGACCTGAAARAPTCTCTTGPKPPPRRCRTCATCRCCRRAAMTAGQAAPAWSTAR